MVVLGVVMFLIGSMGSWLLGVVLDTRCYVNLPPLYFIIGWFGGLITLGGVWLIVTHIITAVSS